MPQDPLIFPGSNVEQRLRNLFKDFGAPSSAKLRAFVDDPTGTVVSELYPEASAQIPAQMLSDANKFLFGVARNPAFQAWLFHYQNELKAKIELPENQGKPISEIISKDQVMTDFATALAENGDTTLIHDYSRISAVSPIAGDSVLITTAAIDQVFMLMVHIDVGFRAPESLLGVGLTREQIRGMSEALTNKPR